jgi:uncharacterized membrane protein YeiH
METATQSLGTLLDHFGISACALSGVLAARGKQFDFFGVLVLALVTAFGGGSLRDILVGDGPVLWLSTPAFLWNACLTTAVGVAVTSRWKPPASLMEVADALALGFFTMAGARKGFALGLDDSAAVTLGIITGVAGGIIRDVMLGRAPMVFQPGTYFYATAAFIGLLAFCGLRHCLPEDTAMWVAAGIVIAVRMASIRYRLALPVIM